MNNYQNNKSKGYVKKSTGTGAMAAFLLALTIFFGIGAIIVACRKGMYSGSDMKDLLNQSYEEIYGDQSNQDYQIRSQNENALIAFVVYPDGKKYDIKCKNSGNIEMFASYYFADKYCTFDNTFDENTPSSGYQEKLYFCLAGAFNNLNTKYESMGYTKRYGYSSYTKIINKAKTDYAGSSELFSALASFHSYSNVNVSIVIDENTDVYGTNVFLMFLFLIPAIGTGLGAFKAYTMYLSEKRTLKEYKDDWAANFSGVQSQTSSNENSDPFEKYDSSKDPFEEYSKND